MGRAKLQTFEWRNFFVKELLQEIENLPDQCLIHLETKLDKSLLYSYGRKNLMSAKRYQLPLILELTSS